MSRRIDEIAFEPASLAASGPRKDLEDRVSANDEDTVDADAADKPTIRDALATAKGTADGSSAPTTNQGVTHTTTTGAGGASEFPGNNRSPARRAGHPPGHGA